MSGWYRQAVPSERKKNSPLQWIIDQHVGNADVYAATVIRMLKIQGLKPRGAGAHAGLISELFDNTDIAAGHGGCAVLDLGLARRNSDAFFSFQVSPANFTARTTFPNAECKLIAGLTEIFA